MNDTFGGGGFDNTQVTGGGGGVPEDKKKEGVVPMVIKQILDGTEDSVTLWGLTIGIVTFPAIVRNIEHSSTKVTYRLEDHTGQIDAHLWLEEGDSNIPQVVVNTYARVYGSVRNQNGARVIMIFRLAPLSSINELTTHLLEVLNARFKAEEYSKKSYEEPSSAFNTNFTANASQSMLVGGPTNGNSNSAKEDVPYGLNPKQQAVYKAIQNHGTETGISIQELQRKFTHIATHELNLITDFLTQEGHAYTSVDAEHFLTTAEPC